MLKCPTCKKITARELWEDSESYCEDCGSHSALKCPNCYDIIDLVYNTEEEMRKAAEEDGSKILQNPIKN